MNDTIEYRCFSIYSKMDHVILKIYKKKNEDPTIHATIHAGTNLKS